MPASVPLRRVDARSLIALAHPLRIRLRDHLRRSGPATATQLAKRFGESSGSTSYHLRMLARHGFVEEARDLGVGRERWWRAPATWLEIPESEYVGDPVAMDAHRLVKSEIRSLANARYESWLGSIDRWSRDWVDATNDSQAPLVLDAATTARMRDELTEVIARYASASAPPDGVTRTVEVQIHIFPTGEPT
jgi:DNA-binding transcriptional ArsR family regulator